MKITSKDIKNYCNAALSVIFIIGSIVFIINWGLFDIEETMEEFDDTMEKTLEAVKCNIDYKEFHFEGFCSDKEDIFNFLEQQYNQTNGEEQIKYKEMINNG